MITNQIIGEGAEKRGEVTLALTKRDVPPKAEGELQKRLSALGQSEASAAVGPFHRATQSEGPLENAYTDEFARCEDVLDAIPPAFRYQFEVASAAKKIEGLSAREVMVLKMLRQGCSSKMIAAEFAMDVLSVERHRASLMRKLSAEHVADAVRIAIYAGLGD